MPPMPSPSMPPPALPAMIIDSDLSRIADPSRRPPHSVGDAISLHSHLGPHLGPRLQPLRHPQAYRPPRCRGRPAFPAPEKEEDNNSTDRLFADTGAGPALRELADADIERRARRRARKKMRRLAGAAAQADGAPGLPQDPTPFLFASPRLPGLEVAGAGAEALAHLRAHDDDDDADLDGGMYARLAPRFGTGGSRSSGRLSNSGLNSNSNPTSNYDNYADASGNATAHVDPFVPPRTKSRNGKKGGKRSTKSGSSAPSSTLASPSPPPYAAIPAFAHAPPHSDPPQRGGRVRRGFNGTPGGFGSRAHPVFESGLGDEAGEEEEGGLDGAVAREALPSPGLPRGQRGWRWRVLGWDIIPPFACGVIPQRLSYDADLSNGVPSPIRRFLSRFRAPSLAHASVLDLFSSLRIIWGRHADPHGESIKHDLCSPAGRGVHAKAFYFLLGRYREDSLRARDDGSLPTSALDGIKSMRFDLGWELV
ncbi:hypothetical protein B0H11DRAFT_2182091 [Mycena galericulata]|nr:hypothetical protein B0H11DRAFT_2182091 [Mycena galericulata]